MKKSKNDGSKRKQSLSRAQVRERVLALAARLANGEDLNEEESAFLVRQDSMEIMKEGKRQWEVIKDAAIHEKIKADSDEMAVNAGKAIKAADTIFNCILTPDAPGSNLRKVIENNPIDALTLLLILDKAAADQFSKAQVRRSLEYHRNSPKKKPFEFMKECFYEWQALPDKEKREKYASQTAFATDMIEKFKEKEDDTPITTVDYIAKKLIPKWNKEKSNPPGMVITLPGKGIGG